MTNFRRGYVFSQEFLFIKIPYILQNTDRKYCFFFPRRTAKLPFVNSTVTAVQFFSHNWKQETSHVQAPCGPSDTCNKCTTTGPCGPLDTCNRCATTGPCGPSNTCNKCTTASWGNLSSHLGGGPFVYRNIGAKDLAKLLTNSQQYSSSARGMRHATPRRRSIKSCRGIAALQARAKSAGR